MKLLCAIPEMIGRVVHGRESAIRPVGWTRNGSLPRPGISLIAGLVVPLLLSSPGVGLAQSVDPTLWVTNGQVLSVAHDGGTTYIEWFDQDACGSRCWMCRGASRRRSRTGSKSQGATWRHGMEWDAAGGCLPDSTSYGSWHRTG